MGGVVGDGAALLSLLNRVAPRALAPVGGAVEEVRLYWLVMDLLAGAGAALLGRPGANTGINNTELSIRKGVGPDLG